MEHLSIRARRGSLDYLRVAQAYMLISMPTHTSAIFGVFQDMLSSKKGAAELPLCRLRSEFVVATV